MAQPPVAQGQLQTCLKDYLSLAVKATSLQSDHSAHLYLTALREAIWIEKADAYSLELPVSIARRVSQMYRSQLDFNRFVSELTRTKSAEALREDLKKVHMNRISIIPTITLTREGRGIKLEGSQSYGRLLQAIRQLVPKEILGSYVNPQA